MSTPLDERGRNLQTNSVVDGHVCNVFRSNGECWVGDTVRKITYLAEVPLRYYKKFTKPGEGIVVQGRIVYAKPQEVETVTDIPKVEVKAEPMTPSTSQQAELQRLQELVTRFEQQIAAQQKIIEEQAARLANLEAAHSRPRVKPAQTPLSVAASNLRPLEVSKLALPSFSSPAYLPRGLQIQEAHLSAGPKKSVRRLLSLVVPREDDNPASPTHTTLRPGWESSVGEQLAAVPDRVAKSSDESTTAEPVARVPQFEQQAVPTVLPQVQSGAETGPVPSTAKECHGPERIAESESHARSLGIEVQGPAPSHSHANATHQVQRSQSDQDKTTDVQFREPPTRGHAEWDRSQEVRVNCENPRDQEGAHRYQQEACRHDGHVRANYESPRSQVGAHRSQQEPCGHDEWTHVGEDQRGQVGTPRGHSGPCGQDGRPAYQPEVRFSQCESQACQAEPKRNRWDLPRPSFRVKKRDRGKIEPGNLPPRTQPKPVPTTSSVAEPKRSTGEVELLLGLVKDSQKSRDEAHFALLAEFKHGRDAAQAKLDEALARVGRVEAQLHEAHSARQPGMVDMSQIDVNRLVGVGIKLLQRFADGSPN